MVFNKCHQPSKYTKGNFYCKQDIKYNKRNIVQIVNHKVFFIIKRKLLFSKGPSFDVRNQYPIEKNVKWKDIVPFFTVDFKQFTFVLPLYISSTI